MDGYQITGITEIKRQEKPKVTRADHEGGLNIHRAAIKVVADLGMASPELCLAVLKEAVRLVEAQPAAARAIAESQPFRDAAA